MTQPPLFHPEVRPPSRGRVELVAGMLAQWAFGDQKPTSDQRQALEAIARDAITLAVYLNPKE